MKRLCTKMEHVHVYKLKPRDLFELLIFWNDRPFLLKLKSVAPEQHFCILNPEPSKNQLNENVALERQFQFFKQFSMSHQSPNNNTKLYAKWHVKRRNRSAPCWLPIFWILAVQSMIKNRWNRTVSLKLSRKKSSFGLRNGIICQEYASLNKLSW